MKKRLLSLALALAMLLSLCACGDGNNAPQNDPEPSVSDQNGPAQDPAPADPAGPDANADPLTGWIIEDDPESITGTVRFWSPFKGSQGMDNLIADFNAIYPNVTVELTTYNNNSDGNLGVDAAYMAEEIDVLASFGLSNTYRRWENGMFIDLTDKIAEEGIDVVANWGSDAYQYDGKFYTFPCGGLSYFVAINMDKWNAAGLGELPTEWTWDEYLDACRKMTEVADDGTVTCYGGSLNHTISDYMLAQYQVTGKDMYYNTETGLSSFNDPINVNALQREYNAEVVEKIWYPLVSYRTDKINVQDVYTSGKIATSIANNLFRYLNDTENYPVDFITGCAPFPVEEKGQTNYCSGVGYFSHAGVMSNAKDQEAAWAFCKFYATYGCKWLIAAGHAPTWKGTDAGSVVEVAFGSQEKAESLVDIESFTRCFANPDNPGYVDTQVIANTDLGSIVSEYALAVMNDQYTVEEACKIMQEKGDEAIRSAS